MISLIYGRPGTGKSTEVIRRITGDMKSGRAAVLLVPEQFAVESEQAITNAVEREGKAALSLEVLNFSRLANSVFRRWGGLSYNYIGRGARALVMWRALCSSSANFHEYDKNGVSLSDRSFIKQMLDAVKGFKAYNITPRMLDRAAEGLADSPLKRRVSDLSLIYSVYEDLLHREYDDPHDDLTLLAETLDRHDYFSGKNVYIDAFAGFTPQEFGVLRRVFRQADNVTLTIGCLPRDRQLCYAKLRDTARTVERLVAESGRPRAEDVVLREYRRFGDDGLRFLADRLWDYSKDEAFEGETRGIRVVECQDIYAECETVAADILRRVRGGARFRDFAVITRQLSDYEGIVDRVFEKYGIPYFMSRRAELTSMPLYRLLMSALAVISGGWRCGEVMTYAKTGLAGLTPDECCKLENYAMQWNVNGRRWTDEYGWSMNPDGYTDVLTEDGEKLLVEVNLLRERLTAPLSKLAESFSGGCTVRNASRGVYDFLLGLGLPDALPDDIGDGGNIRLWNSTVDALDQLVLVAPELTVTADRYAQLFAMILSETDIGRIPASIDEVVIGSADLLRVGKISGVYIIGAVEGVFPQTVSDTGLFNDTEREQLVSQGLELPPGSGERAADELLYFEQAVSCASSFVTVSYYSAELSGKAASPSSACERIKKLFPGLETIQADEALPEDFVECREAAFDSLYRLRGTPAGQALADIYSEDADFSHRLGILTGSVVQPRERLSPETAEKLFGGDLTLTQSRLDSYVLCSFAYGCKYVLKLSERKRAAFKGADMGIFMHRVLERYVSVAQKDGRLDTSLSREEREDIVDGIIAEYIEAICRRPSDRSPRLLGMFSRLRRVTLLLVDELTREFAQSRFIPRFFELPIAFGDPEAAAPFRIPLHDGSSAYIYGKIDRVDVYKKGKSVYVRVVDYKTGVRDFSMADIERGLNLQLLLYLFAIWRNSSDEFKGRLSGDGDAGTEIYPAGVLYFPAKQPNVKAEGNESAEQIEEAAGAELERRGLLLDDEEILKAMDENLGGRYIPVKLKSTGGYTAASMASLATLEEFGALMKRVCDTVASIAGEMKSGELSARPLKDSRHDACEYCPDKAICRYRV